MTLRTLWQGLISWLKAFRDAGDPLADLLGSHEQRLIALEGEVPHACRTPPQRGWKTA